MINDYYHIIEPQECQEGHTPNGINAKSTAHHHRLIIDQDLATQVLGPAKGGKFVCPICNERKFSTSRNGDRGFNCFGCGETKAIYNFFKDAVGGESDYRPVEKTKPKKVEPNEPYRIENLNSSHPKILEFANKRAIPIPFARLNLGYATNNVEIAKFIGWKKTKFTGVIVSKFGLGYSNENQIKPDNPPSFLKNAKYITPKAAPRKLFKSRVPGNYQNQTGNYWERVRNDKSIPLELTEGIGKTLCNQWHYGAATVGASGVNNALSCDDFDELYINRNEAVLKFDADWRENANVAKSMIAICNHLIELNVRSISVAIWNPEYGKGIDDLVIHCQKHGLDWSYGAGVVCKMPYDEWSQICYQYHPRLIASVRNHHANSCNHHNRRVITRDEFYSRFGENRVITETAKDLKNAIANFLSYAAILACLQIHQFLQYLPGKLGFCLLQTGRIFCQTTAGQEQIPMEPLLPVAAGI